MRPGVFDQVLESPVTTGTTQYPRAVACVPAWNAEPFIEKTLAAISAQTYPNLEVLISDDASTDATASICERFASGDARFRVIRQSRNLGWIGNVNALLRAAEGDYLFFAFHDDLIGPTYVARLVEALEANPQAVLAFSDLETVHLDGRREVGVFRNLDGIGDRVERARRIVNQGGDWWIPNRGVFRAVAAKRIGGMRRHLSGEFSADWPWLMHLALLGEFVRVPELLCCKNYKKNSLSRSWSFGTWPWIAASLSCGREVCRSSLLLREKISLLSAIGRRCAHRMLPMLRGRAGRGRDRASDPQANRTPRDRSDSA